MPFSMTVVCSPGGMGSTYVIESLARHLATNSFYDGDALKHCPDPFDPRYSDIDARFVYVWNDPLLSILSHERRGWLQEQCGKLRGMMERAASLEDLWDATLGAGRDVYGILHHAENWLNHTKAPIFFLNMREGSIEMQKLRKFLGLPIDDLHLRRRSHYDLDSIPRQIREIYEDIDSAVVKMGNLTNDRQFGSSE